MADHPPLPPSPPDRPQPPPAPLPTTRGARTRPLIASVRMMAVSAVEYLELLARDAAPVEFEGPVLAARGAGASTEQLAELERAKVLALQVRGVLESRR